MGGGGRGRVATVFSVLLVVVSTTSLQPNPDAEAKKQLPSKFAGR